MPATPPRSRKYSGNRDLRQIVARYQNLVCSLLQRNRSLNQSRRTSPRKLSSRPGNNSPASGTAKASRLVCGIARNLTYDVLKKKGREPSTSAILTPRNRHAVEAAAARFRHQPGGSRHSLALHRSASRKFIAEPLFFLSRTSSIEPSRKTLNHRGRRQQRSPGP